MKNIYKSISKGSTCFTLVPDGIINLKYFDENNFKHFLWLDSMSTSKWDSFFRKIMRLVLEPVIDRYDDKQLMQLYDPEKKEDFLNDLYGKYEQTNNADELHEGVIVNWFSKKKSRKFMKEWVLN